jgi:hypothetical protein
MSKKLIAVAAAAALALTGLVATPASASSFTVDLDASVGVASHATSTNALAAGASNTTGTLDYLSSGSTTRNVVRFVVNAAAATTIAVNIDGAGKLTELLTDSASVALKVGAGSTSLSEVTTGAAAFTFYAYTNSTSVPAKVSISTPTSTSTYWVKATVGGAYNLTNVVFPTSVLSGETNSNTNLNVVSFDITDQFGNAVTTGATATLTGVGATFSGAATYDSTRKKWEANVNGVTQSNVSMQLSLTATDISANGFAAPVIYAFKSVSAGSLADQVTALTAQVKALTAQLAVSRLIENSVTQKKYNTLARKWNAAFPSQRVALKK